MGIWTWFGACGLLQFDLCVTPLLCYINPFKLLPVTSGLCTNVPNIMDIVALIYCATSLLIRFSGTPRELPIYVIRSICFFVSFILVIICSVSDLSLARSFST